MTEKYKLLKIFAFLSIIIIIIGILSAVVSPMKNRVQMDNIDKVLMDFSNEKENTIDVIVIGDSEAYCSVSPLEMYRDYGFTTFVSATPAQYSRESYSILKKVAERQKPKVCVLETNLLFRENPQIISILPRLEADFPIFKYHDMWKNIFDSESKIEASDNSFKGYHYLEGIVPPDEHKKPEKTDKIKQITVENSTYLNKIIDFCKASDIKLVLVSTPSVKNWNYEKHNALIRLSEEKGIPFVDLNLEKSLDIDWNTDTPDSGDHLNYSGAYKVTSFLANYLDNNFHLPDHRKDNAYSSWERAVENYLKKISVNRVKTLDKK